MAEALFPHVLPVCHQFIQLLLFLWPPEEELDVVIHMQHHLEMEPHRGPRAPDMVGPHKQQEAALALNNLQSK